MCCVRGRRMHVLRPWQARGGPFGLLPDAPGVAEGCPLLPLLYAVFIDPVLDDLHADHDLQLRYRMLSLWAMVTASGHGRGRANCTLMTLRVQRFQRCACSM